MPGPWQKESFREAATDLRALLNLALSERAAEQMNQHLAQDAEFFQAHQSLPEPATEGELLVAKADGKGVPMRRPLAERTHRSHPRRGKGEKANKKQMAYVGAVYSINRFPRSAADATLDGGPLLPCRGRRPRRCSTFEPSTSTAAGMSSSNTTSKLSKPSYTGRLVASQCFRTNGFKFWHWGLLSTNDRPLLQQLI